MTQQDMRLQLIIEAFNRTQAAWNELSGQVKKAEGEVAAVNAGAVAAGSALDDAGRKGGEGMKHVHDHAQRTHSMLGNIVQMAIIMTAVLGSKKIAEAGIDYNRTLEISKLGIGAIITSMGVVTDHQGKILQGQEKWNASQQITVEAQRELQKIGMTTAATYQELVMAYQGILAPALGAKMSFRETLDLTGLMTNAVKAMGLPLNQIVQESRDLVSATIDQNSQLARSLQISNEDVKKWREKGIVYQEIRKRLEGFIPASKEFEKTWDGAWSNFKDFAQKALGEGSMPLFTFLKNEIIRLSNDMVNITRDAKGNILDIQVKPEVVSRIRELAEDLKKLIQLLELGVKWGSKLAEPAIWIGVAVGIGKITTAVKELALAANSGGLVALMKNLPALMFVAGVYGGKQIAEAKALSGDAAAIRLKARGETDHDASRLKASGFKPAANLGEFGGEQLNFVRQKLPTATDAQIAAMLRQGIIQMQKKEVPGFNEHYFSVNINDEKAKQYLDGEKSPFNLKGSNKKTAEEIKKERAAAIAALEDSYAESAGTFKVGEAKEAEAIKTGLKEKELAYQQGLITQEEFIQARAELQKKGLQAELDNISRQQDELTKRYQREASVIEDPKELSEKHKSYLNEWYRLEVDKVKKTAEMKRAGFDEELRQVEERRKLEAAERDGALKLLQERLNGEKEINQALLDRGRITPLEAERRAIANEQIQLEAEYWKTFGEKMAAIDTPAKKTKEFELQALKQRMANLDARIPQRIEKAEQDTRARDFQKREADINHRLAQLDQDEKLREVSKADAIRKRKDLLEEILRLQEADLAAIDKSTNTQAWLTQQAAIDATRQKLLDLQLQARDLSDELAAGLREGLMQYVDETGGQFKRMVDVAKSSAQGMEQAFSDFFFDAMTGKLKSFGDYVKSFLNSVARAMSNMLAQNLTQGITGSIASLFSPTASAVPSGDVLVAHSGGLVVPRFHFGGLATDEVPAVLQTRERVFSREQNQWFERFVNKAEGAGGAPNVLINIQNNTGQPMEARQGDVQFDGEQYVVGVIVNNVKNNGVLRGLLAGG